MKRSGDMTLGNTFTKYAIVMSTFLQIVYLYRSGEISELKD
jgi:hypothetical protein